MSAVDRSRVQHLLEEERARFRRTHPRSAEAFDEAQGHLVTGTPMHWMSQWPAGPIFVDRATEDRLVDVDGNEYADFCLGDSAALWGHGRPELARALAHQAARGAQTMLPTRDAERAAAELAWRFPVPSWQFTVSATDANRFAIRIARAATGRTKVLLFDGKYHGCIDDTQVTLDAAGRVVPTPGVASNGVRFEETTTLIEFNDLDGLRDALAGGEIACVLTEPALSNGGLIEPDPGFHDELRRLTREAGTLLIVDETQTIVAGTGGLTAQYGLVPDMVVLGKSLGGGVPCGAWGMTDEVAVAFRRYLEAGGRLANHAGFGGTLAGNALTMSAVVTVLTELSTRSAYERASRLAAGLRDELDRAIGEAGLPWRTDHLGMRIWLVFGDAPVRTARQLRTQSDPLVQEYLNVFLMNRGVILGPFSDGILVSPVTTTASAERLVRGIREALAAIRGTAFPLPEDSSPLPTETNPREMTLHER